MHVYARNRVGRPWQSASAPRPPLRTSSGRYEPMRKINPAYKLVTVKVTAEAEAALSPRTTAAATRAAARVRRCRTPEAYAARCMVEETARRKDEGRNVSTEAACAKMFASEMVGRVADRAVQIHGGAGYVADYAVERFYRDVRLFRIYEGTTQIQQLVIARAMIKEARG